MRHTKRAAFGPSPRLRSPPPRAAVTTTTRPTPRRRAPRPPRRAAVATRPQRAPTRPPPAARRRRRFRRGGPRRADPVRQPVRRQDRDAVLLDPRHRGRAAATAYVAFEECTGADIQHEPSGEFEEQLQIRVQGGNAPDIAAIPQPGLIATLAADGALIGPSPRSSSTSTTTSSRASPTSAAWTARSTRPRSAPTSRASSGTARPPSRRPATRSPRRGTRCSPCPTRSSPPGARRGAQASRAVAPPAGRPPTGSRTRCCAPHGLDAYDQWVAHEIPFNDPQVLEAAELVEGVLLNPDYVGNVQQIAVTAFQEGGLGILDGSCWMHRQANFYGNNFPGGHGQGPRW